MRDFVAYVRRHLPRREVSLEQYDEVVDELASELEARYTALVHRGSDEEDAWQEVLRQVPSWSALAHDLSSTSPGPTTPSRLSSLRNMLSVERWQRELAFGLRVLRKDRGFTLTSIFTIAVCILPREFSFGDPEVRFWIPLALTDRQRSDSARHRNGWFSIGRSPLRTMKLGSMLKESMRGGSPGRAVRATWRTLVVAQMTCSFMLLMGSALLWVNIRNLLAVDPGFRTENVITGITSLTGPRYTADDAARTFVSRALASIRQLPGVVAAGATTIVPMTRIGQTGVVIAEGHLPSRTERVVSGVGSAVTHGYFEAVGTPLVRGRYFDARDDDPNARSIVIDEPLARRFWPGGDAVGRRMFCPLNASELSTLDANTPWLTVIGVVGAARLYGPTSDEAPSGTSGTYYLPYASSALRNVGFVIRKGQASIDIVRDARIAVARIDPEVALFDIRTLSERTELVLSPRTNTMHLAMLFAAVGVFLSALGLYGMLAYLVTQRRREIGIRMAVGSAPRAIVALMLREGLWLALAGVAVGAAASLALGRVVASQLYGVTSSDPLILLVIAAALCGVATVAASAGAPRRADRCDADAQRFLSSPANQNQPPGSVRGPP